MSEQNQNAVLANGGRNIDSAMEEDRPAKQTVRHHWLQTALGLNEAYPGDSVPFFLTLSGSGARDIKLFAEHGIFDLTENGGIAASSAKRVVAIEANSKAVATLQRTLPGLKIVTQNFKQIVQGDSLMRFPSNRQDELYCAARIINLDFNMSLQESNEDIPWVFSLFSWISKLCSLHSRSGGVDHWCLYLTLNSRLNHLTQRGCDAIQSFLAENFRRVPEFGSSCQAIFGEQLYDLIASDNNFDLVQASVEDHQKVLMAYVPKAIIHHNHSHGWDITTSQNFRYGGTDTEAPMVTWIISFKRDNRASTAPDALYRDGLNRVMRAAAHIKDDGTIEQNA